MDYHFNNFVPVFPFTTLYVLYSNERRSVYPLINVLISCTHTHLPHVRTGRLFYLFSLTYSFNHLEIYGSHSFTLTGPFAQKAISRLDTSQDKWISIGFDVALHVCRRMGVYTRAFAHTPFIFVFSIAFAIAITIAGE